jgi:Holliday junction DNA helicase RuvA
MIGALRGLIIEKSPAQLLIEAAGVGYEVEAPLSTFYVLPAVGQEVRLLTHLVVREDAHVLYGFASGAERGLFRALLKISGVGPRIALGILSAVTVDAFAECVRSGDTAALTRIPGVGRKTAERLVIEMRDRIEGLAGIPVAGPINGAAVAPVPGGARGEAYSALVALGYKPAEATRLLKDVEGEQLATEELIRRALQGAIRS